jgi:hypothetical protein
MRSIACSFYNFETIPEVIRGGGVDWMHLVHVGTSGDIL